MYIYIYIYKERERECNTKSSMRGQAGLANHTGLAGRPDLLFEGPRPAPPTPILLLHSSP